MRVVVSHTNADLDALACLVAATRLYEGAVAVGGSSLSPPVHRFLALHKDRFPLLGPEEVDPTEVEEVIVVDVRDSRRLTDAREYFEHASRVVAWDHHPATQWDVEIDEEHVEPVGACITLLLERLREEGHQIPPEEATLFLLGLYADTGRLSYTATRQRDVEAAAFLIGRGAQLKIVNRYLRHELSAEQSGLLVELLANVEEISIDQVEVAVSTASMHKTVRGASTIVQQVMELGGHDAIFGVLHFRKNKRVQIIGRSRVSYVDVGQILGEFGGGGHRGAGAASLKKTDPESVVARLDELLRGTPLRPTRVADIMTPQVRYLCHDTSLGDAKQQLTSWGITGAPVMRDGELSGILSIRDVTRAERGDNLQLPVSSHMSHEVLCVDSQEPIEDALEMMTGRDVGRMPVTRDGEVVGIVTRTDLLRLLYMKVRDDSDLDTESDGRLSEIKK